MDYVDGFFEWQKLVEVTGVNKLPARSNFMAYENADEVKAQYSLDSSRCMSLNGQWRFKLFENYTKRSVAFPQPSFNCGGWGVIDVPSSWQMKGCERLRYCEGSYVWDGTEDVVPPNVPEKYNPVGCYIKKLMLPSEWKNQRITICFEGVEKAFYIYVNGERIGYSENSFGLSEFDITNALYHDRPNTIAVEVYSFCTSSWLENRPGFFMRGIFRDVYLRMTHKAYIWDYSVKSVPGDDFRDGEVFVDLTVGGEFEGAEIVMEVRKRNGGLVGMDTKSASANGSARLRTTVVDLKLWSCEKPYLYTVILRLNKEGKTVEYAAVRTGFKKTEIKNSVLLLNGKRLLFTGVNRDEFTLDNAAATDCQTLEKTVRLMKENNINAVRTKGMTAHAYFYDLCDEYGIYVVDETDIDARASENSGASACPGLPGGLPVFEKVCIDKALCMYEQNKNHTSVILLCLGRACSYGGIFKKMYNALKQKDGDLIVFSGENGSSDIYAQSFVSPWSVEAFIRQHGDKPFILYEYSCALGNSCGGNAEYKRLWNKLSLFQGGFINSLTDRAVMLDGVVISGGDLCAKGVSQCADGLFFADFEPTPKLYEIKQLYQKADFEAIDAQHGKFRIYNNFSFTDLYDFNLLWEQIKQGKSLRSGAERIKLPPGSSCAVDLELNKITSDETYINLKLTPRRSGSVGGEAACAQFIINKFIPTQKFPLSNRNILLRDSYATVNISNSDFEVRFSRRTGEIYSYKYKGRQIFNKPVKPNFWRAPTDMDKISHNSARSAIWKHASNDYRASVKKVEMNAAQTQATVFTEFEFFTEPISRASLVYTVNAGGIKLDYEFCPSPGLPQIPEISLYFELSGAFETVEYFGRGPFENYADRRLGAFMGVYEEEIDRMLTPYLTPQENGERGDIRYALLKSDRESIKIEAYPEMEMNIGRFSPEETERAKRRDELPLSHKTSVRAVARQMGVGGYDPSGSQPLAKHLNLSDGKYTLSFSILPIV